MFAFASAALALLLAAAPPAGAAEPEVQLYGTGQTLSPGLSGYFSSADYPADARRNHDQGLVRFRITVGTDGRVSDCSILGSSGHPALDAATCTIARTRFQFVPNRDEYGIPVGDIEDYSVRWRLPG